MSNSLFRPEALAAQLDRLSGAVSLRQPLRYRLLTVVSVSVVMALILFLVFGEYARRQTSSGHVVPTAGVVKLYPRQSGVLEALDVVDGAQVRVGQVLARINNRREQTGESDIDAQVAQQLRDSVTQLEGKTKEEELLATIDADRLAQQLLATRTDASRLQTQLVTENERLALAEARKQDYERLSKEGFVSTTQFKDQYQIWLDAKLRRDETQRNLAAQQAKVTDLLLQQLQLPGKRATRTADLQGQLSELRQRLIEVESRREQALVAPVAGRVTTIQAKPGQTVTPQLPLLTIIPDGAEFEAELFVPTRAVGFIQQGQQVYLRYQAFPYQRYGLYEGKVVRIASSILAPQEVAAIVAVNEPVYRVTVSLNQQDVAAYGKRFPLQSGMQLEADIVLDRRPIWQWLLEPVLSLRGRI